ncbi:hypothetical protein FA13DRAFT_1734353 [Coprinellus micaceus]|uniref:Uncharacterized protein n=1 Tax=Coprinellus micaceus TaxID=71717 RepID=A0A4Y7T7M4_COPMI|nr:hypothetical protein FA13DRAFT_1734353 [Coprinellus micaceus]
MKSASLLQITSVMKLSGWRAFCHPVQSLSNRKIQRTISCPQRYPDNLAVAAFLWCDRWRLRNVLTAPRSTSLLRCATRLGEGRRQYDIAKGTLAATSTLHTMAAEVRISPHRIWQKL